MRNRAARLHNTAMINSRGGFPSKRVAGCLVAVGIVLATLGGLVSRVPAFYSGRLSVAGDAEMEQLARRMVTKVSALYAATTKPGSWETAFSDREANAWLAIDLPRNHAHLLPRGVAAPRVRFGPRRVSAGARVGASILSAVACVDLDVELRDVNQLGIAVADARLGAIPIPRGPILRQLATMAEANGMTVDFRRFDGRPLLVVYIPTAHAAAAVTHRLESLAIAEGEVLAAGETRRTAGVAGR